jgi:cytidylate kinase
MFRAITISREYGSGGSLIANLLAMRLNWKLVDDSVVAELAAAADIAPDVAVRYDECVDPWFYRMVKAIWRGGYEGVATQPSTEAFDADAMATLWHRAIKEAADIGHCVIVGRGGQCILQEREDVFHVSVYAPLQNRVRLLREMFPGRNDYERLIEETDKRRAVYIQRYFGQDWTNRHLYDLMICSSIGFEEAANVILQAAGLGAKSLESEQARTPTPGSEPLPQKT